MQSFYRIFRLFLLFFVCFIIPLSPLQLSLEHSSTGPAYKGSVCNRELLSISLSPSLPPLSLFHCNVYVCVLSILSALFVEACSPSHSLTLTSLLSLIVMCIFIIHLSPFLSFLESLPPSSLPPFPPSIIL